MRTLFLSPAKCLALAVITLALGAGPAPAQFGVLFSGSGAVNRGMGGVAVATANEATGALYWNPATMSGLDTTQVDLGVELVYPQSRLASSFRANALGPGAPPVPLSGSDRADNGVFPLPSGAFVYKPQESPWTFGIAVFEVGGFGVNYPASNFNPILTPQPPNGVGLGSLFARLQVLEVAPAVSYQITDHLSAGLGASLNLADLEADPAFIAAPDVVPGTMIRRFPIGTHTRWHWGAGLEAGLYYTQDGWRLGASVKSPRWFEKFRFQSQDAFVGRPRNFSFDADLPLVASVGAAYAGFERWLLAADLHYIDFSNANGVRDSGFTPTGAARGIAQHSIWALALGAQYRLSDTVWVRAGYTFNQDPIDRMTVSANVASPTILQHTFSVGASYQVTDTFLLSAMYAHAFQNSVTGPLVAPFGGVPGTSITSVVSADAFVVGATIKFGCKCACDSGKCVPDDGGL
jgi:long-chain fatty acid transport protein